MTNQSMTEQVIAAASAGQPIIDRMRGSIANLPGLQARQSTVKETIPLVNRVTTFVVETCRTDEGYHGFVEAFTPEGMVRLYIPPRVMGRIYSQHASMVKKAKSDRAKAAAETRRDRGIVPFRHRTAADEQDDAFEGETD